MASVNIIKSQVSGTLQNMFPVGGLLYSSISTTETMFTLNAGLVSGTGGGVIPLSLGNPQEYYYSSGAQQTSGLVAGWAGRPFKVRAAGSVIGNTSQTLTISIYQITAAQIALATTTATSFSTGTTKIATNATATVGAVTAPWFHECVLQLSTTGILAGLQQGNIYQTVIAPVTLTNTPSGLVGEADLNFFVTATFASHAGTSQAAILNEFSIEQV